MAVVAALDLDDEPATRDLAHQVDGVHRGLGPGVRVAPQWQAEPSGEVLRHDDGVLRRLGEVRSLRHAVLDGANDGGVGVSDRVHAVAAMEVDVLGPVDVPHARAPAVAQPHHARPGDLPG